MSNNIAAKNGAAAKPKQQQPTSSVTAEPALPLSSRLIDLFIAFWFVVFAFTTTFTDIHNFTASLLGVRVDQLEHMTLAWPPAFLTEVYFKWARTVDPLLYANPMFWQCIEWVNMLVLTPFALIAIPGVLLGASWVRIPAIVVSSFTHYSLILCMGTTLFGDAPSADPAMFIGVYQLYLIFPLLVIARLYGDAPFSSRMSSSRSWLLWLVGSATFAVFFSYVLKWLVVHNAHAFSSRALELLAGVKSLP